MERRNQRWFVDYDCRLTKDRRAWVDTWKATAGQPCQICAYRSACRLRPFVTRPMAVEQALADQRKVQQHPVSGPEITNTEAAELLGISKRQASKLRQSGQLQEALDNLRR